MDTTERSLRQVVNHTHSYIATKEFGEFLLDGDRRNIVIEWLYDHFLQRRYIVISLGRFSWWMIIKPNHWNKLISNDENIQIVAILPIKNFIQQILQRVDAVIRGGYD